MDAARRKFSPEFMNRIDKIVVVSTLRSEHLEQILEIELGMVQQRVLRLLRQQSVRVQLHGQSEELPAARRHRSKVWRASFEARHRAQHCVSTGQSGRHRQVKLGDFIRVDINAEGQLTFVKEAEGALVPVLLERYDTETNADVAAAGKGAEGIDRYPRTRGGELLRWPTANKLIGISTECLRALFIFLRDFDYSLR